MQKVAIVTAASKGMGLAVAKKLHAEGYLLSLMARGEEIHAIARELGAISMQGSVTEVEDLEKLVKSTEEEFGYIDVVVNNTGHSAKGELNDLTDEQWHEGMNILLMNVIRMARIVTPIFERNAKGSLVNISTFGAKEPSLKFPISSVMRAGLGSYTKLYADRYAASGIRMNNVLPGFVDSYVADSEVINNIPMKRQATTEEIAEVVAFLASEKSAYINGQSIMVDGGLTRSF